MEEEKTGTEDKKDSFEKVCFMCRRSESKAGPMITLPGGITVCRD
jgi:ATP-dependent Clp protease ATP-binding subunit ClpX